MQNQEKTHKSTIAPDQIVLNSTQTCGQPTRIKSTKTMAE